MRSAPTTLTCCINQPAFCKTQAEAYPTSDSCNVSIERSQLLDVTTCFLVCCSACPVLQITRRGRLTRERIQLPTVRAWASLLQTFAVDGPTMPPEFHLQGRALPGSPRWLSFWPWAEPTHPDPQEKWEPHFHDHSGGPCETQCNCIGWTRLASALFPSTCT